MLRFALRRALLALAVGLAVSAIAFLLLRVSGDLAAALAGEDAPAAMLARLAKADARVAPLSACVQDVGGISVRATKQPAILLALRDYVRTPEGGSVVLRRTEKPLQPRDRTYDLRLDDGQWSFVAKAQPTPR